MKFSKGHGHVHPKSRFVRKAWVKIKKKSPKTVHLVEKKENLNSSTTADTHK